MSIKDRFYERVLKTSSVTVMNWVAIIAFIAVAGWNWDAWWHVAIGRHTFFSPPHITQFIYIFGIFFGSLILYKQTNRRVFLSIFISELVTIASGIFDIWWHFHFGEEQIITPAIIWSPPHVIGIGATAVGLLLFLVEEIKTYHKNPDPQLFLRICFFSVSLFTILHMLIVPLEPFGWHSVLGPWGALITLAVFSCYTILISRALPKTGIITFTTLGVVTFFGFIARTVAPHLTLPPHADPPLWLHFFAIMPAFMWLDFLPWQKWNKALVGLFLGGIPYLIYTYFWEYVKSPSYNHPQIYGVQLMVLAMCGGALGGLIASLLIKKWDRIKIYFE